MSPEEERLAEALAVERAHGDGAGEFIMERMRALAAARDWKGVERWHEIGQWLIKLQKPDGPAN